MPNRVCDRKIEFKVHDVKPATELLDEVPTGDVLVDVLSTYAKESKVPLLSWSEYNSKSVRGVKSHAFFAAIHLAYSEHRPLVLSPDMIWIVIVQGLAQHISNNAEALRHKLVAHTGRKTLKAFVKRMQVESPEADWDQCITALIGQLAESIVGNLEDLRCDFSTTGGIERAVCDIALLDAFEPYFDYVLYSGCGFPSITLEGAVSDWDRLCQKVELLAEYDIDWWVDALRCVTKTFADAARGNVDLDVWGDMYKQESHYMASEVNGWIFKLVPYVKGKNLSLTLKNPLIVHESNISPEESEIKPPYLDTDMLPSGVAQVPFTLHEVHPTGTITWYLQMLGGFIGVQQDSETFALRPRLGWAVRKSPISDWIPAETLHDCTLRSPIPVDQYDHFVRKVALPLRHGFFSIPNGFANFYRQCDGVELHDSGAQLYRMQDLTFEVSDDKDLGIGLPARFVTFGELVDGSKLIQLIGAFGDQDWRGFSIYKADQAGNLTPLSDDMTKFCKTFMHARGNL